MKKFNLENQFTLGFIKRGYTPHPMRQFFVERNVSVQSLANILEVPLSQLASWFYGKIKIPSRILEELEQIKEQFLKWEAKHGYMFNSRPKPKPICPYAESGLKFRRDFDKYTVCDGCNLRSACEKS